MNYGRNAIINDFVIAMHDFARDNNDPDARELADFVKAISEIYDEADRELMRQELGPMQ